jgi:hypothetical protein
MIGQCPEAGFEAILPAAVGGILSQLIRSYPQLYHSLALLRLLFVRCLSLIAVLAFPIPLPAWGAHNKELRGSWYGFEQIFKRLIIKGFLALARIGLQLI